MAAVPDFQAGAMENWGLILYRETALLYDPRESSTSNKQRVAVVVSHELAHQVCHAMKENMRVVPNNSIEFTESVQFIQNCLVNLKTKLL